MLSLSLAALITKGPGDDERAAEKCAQHMMCKHVLICLKKKKGKKKPSDRRPAAKLRRVYFLRNVMRADPPPDGPTIVEGNQSIFGFLYYDYPGFFGFAT